MSVCGYVCCVCVDVCTCVYWDGVLDLNFPSLSLNFSLSLIFGKDSTYNDTQLSIQG